MTVEVTRAEQLEARARREMATLPAADWEHRAERRDVLEFLDLILDEYNEARSCASS